MTPQENLAAPRVWSMRDPNCPPDAVRIDRRTVFGNPYHIGKDGTRVDVIQKFRAGLDALRERLGRRKKVVRT